MDQVLELKNIHYAYHNPDGETPAINGISFILNKGEFVAIVGPSGCGKSTLLSIIAGLLTPEKGFIKINGKYLHESTTNVGYMLQHDELFEWRTIYNNVILGLEIQHMLTARTREKAHNLLDIYGLKQFENARPSELSGGMRQRAALIRTLVLDPDLLLLDEPFSALDGFLKDTLQLEMLELIEEYQKDVLMVSHSRDEIYRFCDNMVLLEKGSCILKGKTTDIFANPRKMEAARLTGCKNISVAEKRGSHSVYARDWDFVFETEEEVKDSIKYIGIRAHYMKPSDVPEKINSMKIVSAGYTETPFENQHLFKNAENPKSRRLWYIEEKPDLKETTEQPLPTYMIFPKKSLMLLE